VRIYRRAYLACYDVSGAFNRTQKTSDDEDTSLTARLKETGDIGWKPRSQSEQAPPLSPRVNPRRSATVTGS
jgi:hypothetical protein